MRHCSRVEGVLVTLADLREVESGNLAGMWALKSGLPACADSPVVSSSLFLAQEAHEGAPSVSRESQRSDCLL